MRIPPISLGVVALFLSSAACGPGNGGKNNPAPIVGTWIVKIPEAPFAHHMFVFHSDGTMLQANPDAGDPNTSDSNGVGAWVPDGDWIKGKFVEITADRTTRQFVSRGEISFSIKVTGNALSGTASAIFYDPQVEYSKARWRQHWKVNAWCLSSRAAIADDCVPVISNGAALGCAGLTDFHGWNDIVITMRPIHLSIRQIENSHGIVIPKPIVAQLVWTKRQESK